MYNCPTCNTPFELGTKFCPKCGCNLGETFIITPICPTCHKTYPAGSSYCTVDGSKLVSPEKLTPRCVICGTQYSAETKFCPKDGGAVIPEALRYAKGNIDIHSTTYLNKASLGRRFVASLLDCLICVGLSIPSVIFYIIGIANVTHGYYGSTDYSDSVVFFFLAFLLYIIPLVYTFIKDGLGEGQSWGKKAMNIKVINVSDKSNCTKGTSALRALISWLLNLVPFVGWLIEPIMVIATSDGRRLADKAAGTMVVNI